MTPAPSLPPFPPGPGARVVVLEAERGRARRAHLEAWTRAARESGAAAAWLLRCDVERHGLWAGLADWMDALVPALEAEAPALFRKHDAELTAVLPALLRRVCPRHQSLTDLAQRDEGVRNFARDRAFRIGAGVVDLLEAWHAHAGGGRWAVACDDFDRRGALVARFFRDLLRRRGETLGVVLLVAVDPGEGDRAAAELAPFAAVHRVRMALRAGPEETVDPGEAARAAAALEVETDNDSMMVAQHAHELIRLWTAAGRPDRVAEWHATALGLFNHLGYYEDAFRHVPPLLGALGHFDSGALANTRCAVVCNLYTSYVAMEDPEAAREIMQREGLDVLTDPEERARAWYSMAMLHSRFLEPRDMEEGDRCIREGLAEIDRAAMTPEDKQFLIGFLLNGLAFIRFRQGDAGEAAALSAANTRRLDEHLPPGRHRLHRSVLLFNAAQVYAQTGAVDDALRCLGQAMEMDPNWSEYFNDRGNLYLRLGRLEEAERDYLHAVELASPYPEVWYNLGQCWTRMGRAADAEAAFARTVDLDPGHHKAWANLGRARMALGRRDEALEAYDRAVELDGSNALVLANRAALRFTLGRADDALADLERAVALDPANPALRRNRALALQALGRGEEAALAAAAG